MSSRGVELFKIIRDKLGFSRYKMAKQLGISQTQYDYLERVAKSAQTQTLIRLRKISGMELREFWTLLEKESQRVKK